MSRIIVDAIRNSSASSDGITLSSDGKVTFPNTSTGKILQHVHTFKKDAFSDTSGNWVAITGMSVTITAASTSNKLLFNCNLMYGINNLQVFRVRLYDGTSEITASRSTVASTDNNNGWLADYNKWDGGASDLITNISGSYLHTPTDTNSHTYNLYGYAGGHGIFLNRRGYGTDYGGTSTFSVMEIAA